METNTTKIEIEIDQAIACLFGLEAQIEVLTNKRSTERNLIVQATLDRNIAGYKAIHADLQALVWNV